MDRGSVAIPVRGFGETSRQSTPGGCSRPTVFAGLLGALVYLNWAAFHGTVVLCLRQLFDRRCTRQEIFGDSTHSLNRARPAWWPAWLPFSPAFLILWAPAGFRVTCYYYRGAYYKAFWPTIAVVRGRRTAQRFPGRELVPADPAEHPPLLPVSRDRLHRLPELRSHTVSAVREALGRGRHQARRQSRCPRLRHHLGSRLAVRPGRGRAFVEEAPREMLQLEHWGLTPGTGNPTERRNVRPFGGMKIKRTWFAADKTGFHMLHTLFQTSLRYGGVRRFDEWFVTTAAGRRGALPGRRGHRARHGGRFTAWPRRQGRDSVHRRLRQDLPVHDQRQHQERRRHGAGLSGRRAVEGHGVRPVPPHRPAPDRDPDHRGGAGRGWVDAEQGRLPLPSGLRPRHADARTRAALDGARSARPALAGVHQGAGAGEGGGRWRARTVTT